MSEQNPMRAIAKLFTHGRSQAVRLPKEFRFKGKEVRISRIGDRVILGEIGPMPWQSAPAGHPTGCSAKKVSTPHSKILRGRLTRPAAEG
jgi:virulence-associated protein VagC